MQGNRDITTFPFPPTIRSKLLKAGFKSVLDLQDIKIAELSKELSIGHDEALQILKTIKGESTNYADNQTSQGQSAFDLLYKESGRNPIITFSDEIDTMLGGGIPVGKMTEFCGVPGIGKTQMGMQLAVDVHIPGMFGGAEGHCIYIDTEGSFVVDRVVEMADALVNHLREMTESRSDEEKLVANNFTLDDILKNIYYYRIHNYVEQVALVNLLPDFLEKHKNVRLIVMDSVTFPFRAEFGDFAARTRILNTMAQNLMSIAEKFDLAVVLINQVTTRITDNETTIVPALGESWGHTCTNRIILFWQENQRRAHLYKSPSKKAATVPFQVTSEGIRGVRYVPPSTVTASQYSQSQYDASQSQSQYDQPQSQYDVQSQQSQTSSQQQN